MPFNKKYRLIYVNVKTAKPGNLSIQLQVLRLKFSYFTPERFVLRACLFLPTTAPIMKPEYH